jgi:hypothetical protein
MEHTAFALREELAGTVEIVPEEGADPVEVRTSNTPLVELLREYPALKEVAAPDGAVDSTSYADWTAAMLRDKAEELGLAKGGSKDELRARIEAHEAAALAGDEAGAANPTPEETQAR